MIKIKIDVHQYNLSVFSILFIIQNRVPKFEVLGLSIVEILNFNSLVNFPYVLLVMKGEWE